ncbi:MAG: 6-phosphogluconolactonase [Candidatus Pacebacteria bacterium]|nr:6-phosphogluconolactonase [Candidatus Paceibacterota bacterium]MBP9832053.1 6-phosphogluconolactonase [Candidatus Paceibacterota bacterium]
MEIIRNLNEEVLKQKAGAYFSSLLMKMESEPALILFSSGSALGILMHVTAPENTSNLTLGVLDERFTKDPKENNFATLKETNFFKNAVTRGARAIDTSMRFERVETLATTMEQAWRKWIEENPTGHILATFGMGVDAHTAGIMPYSEDTGMFEILFEDERRAVVGYDARGKNPIPLRATVTLPFLRKHITGGAGYITGVNKKPALERTLAQSGTYAETPARVFSDIPAFALFTDIML